MLSWEVDWWLITFISFKSFFGYMSVSVCRLDAWWKLIWRKPSTVQWPFLQQFLLSFGFPDRLVHLIMQCVVTTSFSISVNGNIYGFFQRKKGCVRVILCHLISLSFVWNTFPGCLSWLLWALGLDFIQSVVLRVLVILPLQTTSSCSLGEIGSLSIACTSSSYHLGTSLGWLLTEKSLLFILAELESR